MKPYGRRKRIGYASSNDDKTGRAREKKYSEATEKKADPPPFAPQENCSYCGYEVDDCKCSRR